MIMLLFSGSNINSSNAPGQTHWRMPSPLLQLANQLRLIEKLYCDQLYSNYVDQKVFDIIYYLDYRMRLVFAFDN